MKGAAGELTNLRDSFRQAALVSSKKSFEDFEGEVAKLRARLDKVRALCLTPPNIFFWLAQRKVNAGDYSFDLDLDEGGRPTIGPVTTSALPAGTSTNPDPETK